MIEAWAGSGGSPTQAALCHVRGHMARGSASSNADCAPVAAAPVTPSPPRLSQTVLAERAACPRPVPSHAHGRILARKLLFFLPAATRRRCWCFTRCCTTAGTARPGTTQARCWACATTAAAAARAAAPGAAAAAAPGGEQQQEQRQRHQERRRVQQRMAVSGAAGLDLLHAVLLRTPCLGKVCWVCAEVVAMGVQCARERESSSRERQAHTRRGETRREGRPRRAAVLPRGSATDEMWAKKERGAGRAVGVMAAGQADAQQSTKPDGTGGKIHRRGEGLEQAHRKQRQLPRAHSELAG